MAKVTLEGIKDTDAFLKADVELPKFDVKAAQEHSLDNPVWVHFGPGNIFRGFIASLQQDLLNKNLAKTGIITVDTIDSALVDLIYKNHDKLCMEVTLLPDTNVELRVIGSVVNGFKFNGSSAEDEKTVRAIFTNPSLQMISFTITEKGYAIKDLNQNIIPAVAKDIENGPAKVAHTMSIVTSLLFDRFKAGKLPLAVVSMDNCSHNGDKIKDAVLTIAKAWQAKGFVGSDFIDYLTDPEKISFPWTMIDKITPRPDDSIVKLLAERGIEDMQPIKTQFGSFLAPFVNAEKPQYLVIEDHFPNGRPQLEAAGVLFTKREGVDLCERMKVTTCLNPLHTALAVFGCVLGYTRISAEMEDPDLCALVNRLGYKEGLPVVDDPKILNPKDFLTEVIEKRLTNKCLPDSPQRIATDTSQKVVIRFGETLKNYQKKNLDTSNLVALPLAIAGWLRYLLAIDDNGQPFELSSDPLAPMLQKALDGIVFGDCSSVGNKLQPILSNKSLFAVDLYEVGIGALIETMFKEMICGKGAVRQTLQKYLSK